MTIYTARADQTPPVNSLNAGDTLVLTPSTGTASSTGLLVQGTMGSTLELSGASGAGTLSGLGSSYAGFGTINVDAGSAWTLTGANTISTGEVLNIGAGSTLTVANGTLDYLGGGTVNFNGAGVLSLDSAPNGLSFTNFGLDDVIRFTGLNSVQANGPFGNSHSIDLISAGYWVQGQGNSQLTLNFPDQSYQGTKGYTARVVNSTTLEIAVAPQVVAISASASNGATAQTGDLLTFTLTTDTGVAVGTSGPAPVLDLNTGDVASFDRADSTATSLVFHKTVTTGDFTPDLKVTGLDLLGASMTDAVGGSLDPASVPGLSGSDTGVAVFGAPATSTAAPPAGTAPVAPFSPIVTPTSTQVHTSTVIVVNTASGTTTTTPSGAANTVLGSNSGNGVVLSQGADTIKAGAGSLTVYASGGATVLGGSGNLTVVGNASPDFAVGGSGTNLLYGGGNGSYLFAGAGNSTLVGGTGNNTIMYGNTGSTNFVGSASGHDIMVGGSGSNTFSMTDGDVAFGGTTAGDTFNMGTGSALIVQGTANDSVVFGGGTATAFAGLGTDTYTVFKGLGGDVSLIGFKASDHIALAGGFTAANAASAVAGATRGAFGTTLNLTDGTTINVFGVSVSASQISLG